MLYNPILLALALAACVQLGSSSSVAKPRSAAIERRHEKLPGRGPLTTEVATVIESWSIVEAAFATCASGIHAGVAVEVAIASIRNLRHTTYEKCAGHSSCSSCSSLQPTDQAVIKFKAIIVAIFTSWQTLLSAGQAAYPAVWKTACGAELQQFDAFFTNVKTICQSFNLDLSVILSGIGLHLDLFLAIGIDLGSLLGINLGGIIGVHL
ncbi:hypothetical protein O181_031882 [Austropuccinia psidii MF-1]|uniref:Uncharacterized protein n=1 Tax=Austropuccinia psidii MF-1 TaxID=1389203 RepID=A0A9Q3D1I8_9BASI|nr:hypothetical protein [Austropuccinia psidii MF-1]